MLNNNGEQKTSRHWILIACMLAIFMTAIEVTIVATAMPTIIADLGGFAHFSWVFSTYLLTQAISVPICGRLADLYDRKGIFLIGTIVFLIGSVLCGFANNMFFLILCRGFQGLGAGAIIPLTSTIITDVYLPKERANIQGWLSSIWGIAAILGPLTGAWFIQNFNWAFVFWINVPIGILSMLLLARYSIELKAKNSNKINLINNTLFLISISTLLLLFQTNILDSLKIFILIIVLLITLSFFLNKKNNIIFPLLPSALWKSRILIAGNAGNLLIGAAMMGISAFLPTWIQGVNGGTPLQAGSTLAMMSVGWPLASMLSGRLMEYTSYRFTARVGSLLLIMGTTLLVTLCRNSPMWHAAVFAFIIGAGMGMTSTTFLIAVQNTADFSIRGICIASIMFSRMIGSAVGSAIMGAVLNYNLMILLPSYKDPVQQVMSHKKRLQLEPLSLQQMLEGIAQSLHWVFVVSMMISVLSLVISRYIPAHKPSY